MTLQYYHQDKDGRVAVLVIYVDDVLFSGDYTRGVEHMRTCLLARYKGQDLGALDKLLNVGAALWMAASHSRPTRLCRDHLR